MFQALDAKTQHLVLAINAQHKGSYICPECHETLVLRHGQSTIAHFAHRPGSTCSLGAGETEEHLLGKQQIFQWAKDHYWKPALEQYLPTIQQRPDILINFHGQRIALEFQCSPLSINRLCERNAGYHRLGIRYRWLLGSPYLRKLHVNKVAQFTQLVNGRPSLIYWNTNSQRIIHVDCQGISLISRGIMTEDQIMIGQTKRIQTSLRHRELRWRKLTMMAYQRSHLLAACPLVAHDCRRRWPVCRHSVVEWRIQCLLGLEQYPIGYCWSLTAWQSWLKQSGQWLLFPCLSDNGAELIRDVMNDFTNDLKSSSILIQRSTTIQLKKYPVWFPSVETKLGRLYAATNPNSVC